MANVSFTRDEIILSLDVLYSAEGKSLSPASESIKELSAVLNKLPIHPLEKRPDNFRNCVGVSHQIERFERAILIIKKYGMSAVCFFRLMQNIKANMTNYMP